MLILVDINFDKIKNKKLSKYNIKEKNIHRIILDDSCTSCFCYYEKLNKIFIFYEGMIGGYLDIFSVNRKQIVTKLRIDYSVYLPVIINHKIYSFFSKDTNLELSNIIHYIDLIIKPNLNNDIFIYFN